MWNLPTPRHVKAYEPKLNTYSSKKTMKKERSLTEDTQESFSSSGDAEEDLLPEIVPVSSLGSFSDSSTVSAASSPGGVFAASSPASPTRSIFKNYWASSSSPRACRVKGSYYGDDTEEETELLLRKLSLPFGDSSPAAVAAATISSPTFRRSASAQVAQSPAMVKMNIDESIPPRRSSIDDTSIDYGWNNKTRRVTASPRRQILPTIAPPPPPPPPVSVTNDQASHPVQLTSLRREQFQRNYSSTTALIKRPTHSCLRPSRYSCSMIDERRLSTLNNNNNNKDDKDVTTTTSSTHAAAAIASRSTLTRSKSVSFYSQVSVFEFFEHSKMMDDHPSEEVWSKYFA